jgi:hypothetical protein
MCPRRGADAHVSSHAAAALHVGKAQHMRCNRRHGHKRCMQSDSRGFRMSKQQPPVQSSRGGAQNIARAPLLADPRCPCPWVVSCDEFVYQSAQGRHAAYSIWRTATMRPARLAADSQCTRSCSRSTADISVLIHGAAHGRQGRAHEHTDRTRRMFWSGAQLHGRCSNSQWQTVVGREGSCEVHHHYSSPPCDDQLPHACFRRLA